MKKLILSIILLLIVVLFLSPKADAQTREECDKTRARASYNCLTGWTKCFYPCTDRTKDVSACYKTCSQSRDACEQQVNADYKACLAVIPKEGVKTPTETKKETQRLETLERQTSPSETKKETPSPTETAARLAPDPRDLIFDYLVKKAAQFGVSAPTYWEIKPEDFIISAGAPKPEGGNIWIVEPRTKAWIKAKGQDEYKPFDFNTKVEPGSYIKTETPVDFWVEGVGRVQLRPGPSGSGMFTVEEINGEISPFLLLGEMEVKYGKPIEEATQKPIDWEQIKFEVRTPNSFTTVSRTHYLVRYDEKENETTVAVLEGAVEVAPNGGKAISIIPDGDKPGVVVVSQKLSIVKLAIISGVLAAILGGIVWFIKRKKKK